eukprot:g10371.t1
MGVWMSVFVRQTMVVAPVTAEPEDSRAATAPSKPPTVVPGEADDFVFALSSQAGRAAEVDAAERVRIAIPPSANVVATHDYANFRESHGTHTFLPWLSRLLTEFPAAKWFVFLDPLSLFTSGAASAVATSVHGTKGKSIGTTPAAARQLQTTGRKTLRVSFAKMVKACRATTPGSVRSNSNKKARSSTSSRPSRKMVFLAEKMITDAGELRIIHHYNRDAISYPSNGNFAVNRALAENLLRYVDTKMSGKLNGQDFVIDPLFELAKQVKKMEDDVLFMRGLMSTSSGRESTAGKSTADQVKEEPWPIVVQNFGSDVFQTLPSMTMNTAEEDEANGDRNSKKPAIPNRAGLPVTAVATEFLRDLSDANIVLAVKTTGKLMLERVRDVFRTTLRFPAEWVRRTKSFQIVYMLDADTARDAAQKAAIDRMMKHTEGTDHIFPDFDDASEQEDLDFLSLDWVQESAVYLPINNTKRGHCGKMSAILNYDGYAESPDFLVVSDDDTFWNVPALQDVLREFRHGGTVRSTASSGSSGSSTAASAGTSETTETRRDAALYLGERYGYGVAAQRHTSGRNARRTSAGSSSSPLVGYDYITTGGGMVLNREALQLFREAGFVCHKEDTPDDMTLGMWFRDLQVRATHHAGFHQRRPEDYPTEYLYPPWSSSPTTSPLSPKKNEDSNFAAVEPVSFHNVFSQTMDPLAEIYYPWLIRRELRERLEKVEVDERSDTAVGRLSVRILAKRASNKKGKQPRRRRAADEEL